MDLSTVMMTQEADNAMLSSSSSSAAGASADARAGQAAQDFEAVFLSEMMQHMFKNVDFSALGGDEQSQDVYKEWLVDEYGKSIAKAGGIGIAGYVKQELLHLQEVHHGKRSA